MKLKPILSHVRSIFYIRVANPGVCPPCQQHAFLRRQGKCSVTITKIRSNGGKNALQDTEEESELANHGWAGRTLTRTHLDGQEYRASRCSRDYQAHSPEWEGLGLPGQEMAGGGTDSPRTSCRWSSMSPQCPGSWPLYLPQPFVI